MRADHGLVCKGACHRKGAMMSYEDHHIQPQEWHGPTVPDNMARICPNAHSNIHLLLNLLVRGKVKTRTDPVFLSYSPTERALAWSGWLRIQAYAAEVSP